MPSLAVIMHSSLDVEFFSGLVHSPNVVPKLGAVNLVIGVVTD